MGAADGVPTAWREPRRRKVRESQAETGRGWLPPASHANGASRAREKRGNSAPVVHTRAGGRSDERAGRAGRQRTACSYADAGGRLHVSRDASAKHQRATAA